MTPNPRNSPEYGAAPPPTSPANPATLNTTRARQGVTTGAMRYVLAISMVAAVVVLVIAFFMIR